MKKIRVLLSLLVLFGCRGGTPPGPTVGDVLSRPFEAAADARWGEESYRATLRRAAEGALTIELHSDSLPTPVTFCCEGGGLELRLGDLSLRLPENDSPPSGLAATVSRAVERLANQPLKQNGGVLTASEGELRLTVDPQSRLPLTLESDRGILTFTEFTYLD